MTQEGLKKLGKLNITRPDGSVEALELILGHGIRAGRMTGNELVLPYSNVSRFHTMFNVSADGVVINDLGSRNGTFLNGERIAVPVKLKNGDTVSIADVQIAVELAHAEAAPVVEANYQTQAVGLKVTQVTVLVADVTSYTRMSETLPKEDVAEMLDTWLAVVTNIIRQHSGFVDKYIGDAVMAIWHEGVGVAKPRKPKELAGLAFKGGLEILRMTEKLNEAEWKHKATFPWKCKISMSSGEVMFGTMGASHAREYTFVGDSVNLAFRLNDMASELKKKCVMAQRTAELIQEEHPVVSLGKHSVEGKTQKVEVFAPKELE